MRNPRYPAIANDPESVKRSANVLQLVVTLRLGVVSRIRDILTYTNPNQETKDVILTSFSVKVEIHLS